MLFGPTEGRTLREFKKIMKIELEENPERYSIDIGQYNEKATENDRVKVANKRDLRTISDEREL